MAVNITMYIGILIIGLQTIGMRITGRIMVWFHLALLQEDGYDVFLYSGMALEGGCNGSNRFK